jgi:hypothetical protein
MTCEECLSELATGSLREMRGDSAVMAHCATCPDCGPLATALREREYTAATLLNNLRPLSNPITVAEKAGALARRRRIGKVAVFASGVALVLTFWAAMFATDFGRSVMGIDGAGASELRTETIPLSCLSPEQAADIINPYVRAHGSTYYIGHSGVAAITVRGTAAEIAKSQELIRQFESNPRASCHTSLADRIREIQKAVEDASQPREGLTPPTTTVVPPSGGLVPPVKKQ